MNARTQLSKLASKHNRWVGLVRSMGCNPSLVEDVVQDSYLKVWKYLEKGKNLTYGENDVNDFYMYMTLRSVYFDGKKKKNVVNSEIKDQEVMDRAIKNLVASEASDIESIAFERLVAKIHEEVNTWEFYHRNVFIAYFTSGLSLDKLSKDIGIGRSSLYNSVKKYREVIRDLFSEDAEDYFNGQYELIKK
jgi:DNA-directed RNA polymerase specialized sigma24 family protein